MPWDARSTMSLRAEFVALASQDGANIRALCRHYGITPATAYKWLRRFQTEGPVGIVNRSTRPHFSPRRTAEESQALILSLALQYPYWGARKLKAYLEQRGHSMPAASTVHAILLRQGHRPAPAASLAVGRFEHDAPNQLWQMDFKGHFPLAQGRSHPLTLLDDHSRFSLCLQHCDNERRETVQQALAGVFERYGLPERMTMDNGAPWGDRTGTWTGLELWLMRQGIKVGHSRPYHPQTQGKLERFHRSLKAELLQGKTFTNGSDIQHHFSRWRDVYNLERPHEALKMAVPASRYQPSPRCYIAHPAAAEYDDGVAVRKVDSSGWMSFCGEKLKVGKGFIRERLGIKESGADGVYEVWWYSHKVGVIDLKKRSIQMGKQC